MFEAHRDVSFVEFGEARCEKLWTQAEINGVRVWDRIGIGQATIE